MAEGRCVRGRRGGSAALAAGLLLAGAAAAAADVDPALAAARSAFTAGDYARAVTLWRAPAQAGDAEAQYELGRLYGRGLGVEQSYSRAIAWYLEAAKQQHAEAQHLLCLSYATGHGVALDRVKAYAWCTLAIDNGADAARATRALIRQDMSAEQVPLAEEVAVVMQRRLQAEAP